MVTHRPAEEIARLGDELYERDIRQEVEADHRGSVVPIDVGSGAWAIGDAVIAARTRLRTERPDAIELLVAPGWASGTASLRRSPTAEP